MSSSEPRNRTYTSKASTAEQSLRLRLKPTAPTVRDAGYVDGAWWPRSRDLAAELPALFEALAGRLGVVDRLAYSLTEWDTAVRRLDVGGHLVRLGGFRYQRANTIGVSGWGRGRLTLLVIPPETSATDARTVSIAAAGAVREGASPHRVPARTAGSPAGSDRRRLGALQRLFEYDKVRRAGAHPVLAEILLNGIAHGEINDENCHQKGACK